MRMNLDLVASGHFVLGRDVLCEFDYWPLAVCLQQRYARRRASETHERTLHKHDVK